MPFTKGQIANPKGRPKGAKGKLRKPLVDEIIEIAEELAQQGKGLRDCAKQNPDWFFVNFLKNLIPKNIEVTGSEGGPIQIALTERLNKALERLRS